MAVKALGLNLGERVVIGGKKHEILNDFVDVKAALGNLVFISIDGTDQITEQQEQNGRMVTVPTGEISGYFVSFAPMEGGPFDTVTVTGMSLADLEALELNMRDEIELIEPVLTVSRMTRGNVNLKLFAEGIRKKSGNAAGKQEPKKEQHQNQEHKG